MLKRKITPKWVDKFFCILEILLITFNLVYFPYDIFLPKSESIAYATPGSWSQTTFNGTSDGTYSSTEPKNANADAGLTQSSASLSNSGGGSWSKKAPVSISNYQSTFQTKITLSYDADMQSDFDDIRFFDATASQELNYWLESKVDSSSATIWFKTGSNNNIYIYYGNSSATSSSNGGNTFEFFDGFDGSSLDGTKWNSGSSVTVSGGIATIGAGNITTKTSYSSNNIAEGRLKLSALGTTSEASDLGFFISGSDRAMVNTYGSNQYFHAQTNSSGIDLTSSPLQDTTNYHIWTAKRLSEAMSYSVDYSSYQSNSSATIGSKPLSIRPWNQSLYADWARVRKAIATEPSTSVGSEVIAIIYAASGYYRTNAIGPYTGFYDWGNLTWNKVLNGQTLTVDVLRASDNAVLATNVASGTDLSSVISNSETSIKLKANFSGDTTNSALLNDWSVAYSTDTAAPTGTMLGYGTIGAITLNVTGSGATDSESGLPANPYYIERDDNATTFASADANSGWVSGAWNQSSLTSNTPYAYRIKAKDNIPNESGWVTPTPAYKYTLSDNPTGAAATDGTYFDKITVSWSSGGNQSGYRVYRDGDKDTGVQVYDDTGTSFDNTITGSHSYYVYSKNGDGTLSSGYSTDTGFTMTIPPAPTIGTPTDITTTSIKWNYSNVAGEDGYRLHDSSEVQKGTAPADQTYIDEGSLSPNTLYTRHVHAYNGSGESDPSSDASDYTLSDPPTLPVATDGVYPDKINVSWSPSATANHYHVYRDGISGVGTLVHDAAGVSFDDTITGSRPYYIYSVNSDTPGVENLNYITDEGSTMVVPIAPTAGVPSALTSTSIQWNFTDNASNEAGFRIYDGLTQKVEDATPNLDHVDEGSLTPNTSYTRQVKAYNAAGESSASTDMVEVTLASIPPSPTAEASYDLTDGYHTDITINTGDNPLGTLFALTPDDGLNYVQADGSLGASPYWSEGPFIHKNLNGNSLYAYKVKAKNSEDIETLYSDAGSDITPPSAPLNLSAASIEQTTATVTWDASGGADSYTVSYGTDAQATNLGTVSSDTNSKGLTSLTADETYYYKVRATSVANGVGAYSSIENFTTDTLHAPSTIGQYKVSGPSISQGGYINETSAIVRLEDVSGAPDSTTVWSEIEVKPLATAFDGADTTLGDPIAYSGSPLDINTTVSSLVNLNGYHYRARIHDNLSRTSPWAEYNSGGLAFTIDQVEPNVSITSPATNAYVKGTVSLTSSATDNLSMGSVSFYRDNLSTLIGTDSSSPYSVSWSTAGKDGSRTIYAVARDSAGNTKTTERPIKVDNYRPRTYAPRSASVRRNSIVRLYYRASDPYSTYAKTLKIVIKKSSSTKKTISMTNRRTNQTLYYSYRASLGRGTYYFYIYAIDQANNTQYNVARNKLVIR